MIKTGLPYDFTQMEKIREEGALVDMSDINFPGIDKEAQSKTVFIFLRNTGFQNVKLDFANCRFCEKEDILDEYLTTGFDVYLPELVEGAREVLCNAVGVPAKQEFFTVDEAIKFYFSHKELCDEIIDILASSFLFVIKTTEAFKDAEVDETGHTKYAGKNISNLFKMENIDGFLVDLFAKGHKPKYYEDIFTLDNHALYEAVHEFTFLPALLYGLGAAEPEAWNEVFKTLEESK